MFASDLVRTLGSSAGVRQRVVVLRGSPDGELRFEAPLRLLGSGRWLAPGLRVDLAALRALRAVIGEWSPDLVQAHGGEPLKYAVPAAIGTGVRVVYRKIGKAPALAGRRVRRAAHGGLIRRAARVVAVADVVRREAVDVFGVSERQIVTIPNAVDASRVRPSTERAEARRALGIAPAAPVVLSLGALSEEKDPTAQVEIAARLLRSRPEARYVIAGDGPMRAEVEATIRRRGLAPGVLLLGSRSDVADLLGLSDVLVLTSRTEGMPAAIIEAGMAGLPVAAYAVGGVPEVVVQGATGMLAAPGDLDGLSDGVLGLVRDEDGRRAMGRAARERCLSRFEIRPVAARYLELYRELIEAA